MYGRNANREDAAREHPLRAAILELLAEAGEAMSLSQIQANLPRDTAPAAVAYHLRVLGEINLVAETAGHYALS